MRFLHPDGFYCVEELSAKITDMMCQAAILYFEPEDLVWFGVDSCGFTLFSVGECSF